MIEMEKNFTSNIFNYVPPPSITCSSLPSPALTKIVGTLPPRNLSIDVIADCLKAGMSVARFDLWMGNSKDFQQTCQNLNAAIFRSRKRCALMLDTLGPKIHIINKSRKRISLAANDYVTLTPYSGQEASSQVLPIIFGGLAKAVKKGDIIFVSRCLSIPSAIFIKLVVDRVEGVNVVCKIDNPATLVGKIFTLFASGVLATLTDKDKESIRTWGASNSLEFLSLSCTRHAKDVLEARSCLSELGGFCQTQVFAKIEDKEGCANFLEILEVADGIILSRGPLALVQSPEELSSFQNHALLMCNTARKPAVVADVGGSIQDAVRTAADAVRNGCDAILLGVESLSGSPSVVDVISSVGKACAEEEKVLPRVISLKDMTPLKSIASSVVFEAEAIELRASAIICFTSSGKIARLIAECRPSMRVLAVFVPMKSHDDQSFTIRVVKSMQLYIVRGLFAITSGGHHPDEPTGVRKKRLLKYALEHVKARGVVKGGDEVVVCQGTGQDYAILDDDYEVYAVERLKVEN